MKKKNLEVCAECDGFPCSRFEGWDGGDSFVTHERSISNLNSIKEQGMEEFIKQQMRRIELLKMMLEHFNEGRSKSFYCIAAALLSIADLEKALRNSEQKIKADRIRLDDVKVRSKILKGFLNECAAGEEIELKLRK